MIARGKINEAERLLAEGKLSQRKIARAIGISRATVGAIAAGKRPDYEARQRARAAENEPLGPLERCAGCGGMVHMPCRLCRTRQAKHAQEEAARLQRKRTREQAARQLLAAVVRASREREARGGEPTHPPAAAATGGASDCR